MAVNKVVINNVVKIDLSSDTVAPENVKNGYTFHDNEGVLKTGTYDPSSEWVAILNIYTQNTALFNQEITITKVVE